MASQFETFVLVEMTVGQTAIVAGGETGQRAALTITPQPHIKRMIRTYEDKTVGENALELLRDAFAPDHARQFDLIPVAHIDR